MPRNPSTSIDTIINELASAQHGVVARRQLRARGVRGDALRSRIAAGLLVERSPRVLRVAGAPDDDLARLSAAALDAGPGAVISHAAAAARWGLPGFRADPVHVITSRSDKRVVDPIGVVHRPCQLTADHIVELDHIATTTPTRTLFDLAGSRQVSTGRLERLIDAALARRLTAPRALALMLDELSARGRPGIARMRELLDERPVSYVPPESGLEAAFEVLARDAGLLELERQVDVGDAAGWVGRVDFLDRSRGVIFEVGDTLFHGSITDRRRDEQRHTALCRAGWRVEVVDGFDVFHRRTDLIARLRRLIADADAGRLAA